MKIALIGPTYPFRGGIAHYTTMLYRTLKKRHDIRFFSFSRQYPKWLFPGKTDIDPSDLAIVESGAMPILDSMNPATWLAVARSVVKFGADAVILPWWVSFWAPQFFLIAAFIRYFSKTRVIYICHNAEAHESGPLDRLLTRGVLGASDGIIVHSRTDQEYLKGWFPRKKVLKVHHPTYEVFKEFDEGGSAEIRREYGLEGNVILFFGFVRPYKGLRYLLEAIPVVLSERSVTLLVVGEFWNDKADYEELVIKLGIKDHVRFVDEYIPNEKVPCFFSVADLVVQPYVSATGSGVVQIAFGFEKPVVATRVGCLSEVIDDGKTGYLVPSKSSVEIARAIIRFFKEGKSDLFRENIKANAYRFSWDRLVDTIEELAGVEGH